MHNEATEELYKIKDRDRIGKRQPELKVAEPTKEDIPVRHQRKTRTYTFVEWIRQFWHDVRAQSDIVGTVNTGAPSWSFDATVAR